MHSRCCSLLPLQARHGGLRNSCWSACVPSPTRSADLLHCRLGHARCSRCWRQVGVGLSNSEGQNVLSGRCCPCLPMLCLLPPGTGSRGALRACWQPGRICVLAAVTCSTNKHALLCIPCTQGFQSSACRLCVQTTVCSTCTAPLAAEDPSSAVTSESGSWRQQHMCQCSARVSADAAGCAATNGGVCIACS